MPLEEIRGWAASIYPMPWFTPYLRKGQRLGHASLVHTLVWHQGISEFMAPHVSSNIWSLRCTQPGVRGRRPGVSAQHRKLPQTQASPEPSGRALHSQ